MAAPGYGGIDIVDDRTATLDRDEKNFAPGPKYDSPAHDDDPFGNEEFAEVRYKTLSWW